MKELFVVVDMQNDFVTGALANPDAAAIIPDVRSAIEQAKSRGASIAFTRDTHGADYLDTQEGKNLPVPHCISGSRGHAVVDELIAYTEGAAVFDKPAFGSVELARYVADGGYELVTLVGVCTDICVISNAFTVKAFAPETRVRVLSSCCAGVSVKSHLTALDAMRAAQIEVI